MEKRPLGADGPHISVIGAGGWEAGGVAWGPNPPLEHVTAALHVAFDNGVNWVDTAEIYGAGSSEEVIGRAIEGRDEVMVFTKVASAPRGSGYEPEEIRRAAEASLRRLRRDVIDIYQLHWPSDDTPLEHTWEAMATLVDRGIARYIGVSNFPRDLIERCEAIRHVDSLQPQLSILWREHRKVLDFCKDNGIGVIAYGPLAYGLLTGAITRETTFPDDDWRSGKHGLRAYDQLFAPNRFERNLDIVDRLRPIATEVGISLPQLALAWVIHQPGVTGAIAGSRSPRHVRENAAAGKVELSAEQLASIEAAIGADESDGFE